LFERQERVAKTDDGWCLAGANGGDDAA
jgi:hypothetical protein